jgi:RNA recognition motif-containing protein
MGRKLYVGNLPYSTTEQTLEAKFSEHGRVESVNLITDRDTGSSKGFGFVEMSTDAEANSAISNLNGAEIDGRAIKVNEAKPQVRNSGRGGGGGGGGFGGRGRW